MTFKRKFMKHDILLISNLSIIITTLLILYYTTYNHYKTNSHKSIMVKSDIDSELRQAPRTKYILVWTNPAKDPIMHLSLKNITFVKRNCPVTNCFVSPFRNHFSDVTKYDVIVFHGPDLNISDLPKFRSRHQKYVFASMESPDYYPVCSRKFNGFFNWTWTYKFNSDEEYGYISIWDNKGKIIGPKAVMHWKKVEEMEPINDALKEKLSTKKHAAAWFVSNCNTPSKRNIVANQLAEELSKYNLSLHVYGRCGTKKCPRIKMSHCLDLLEEDYYFYLSFENSLTRDYVTEKLLHAVQHYTVPVVYGGANYTRFMPDGMYLNVRTTSVDELAREMADMIKNKTKYYEYFKWHQYYSYHDVIDSPESDAYCKLCALINNEKRFKEESVHNNLVSWWTPPNKCVNNSE